jgi:hypothetical protein
MMITVGLPQGWARFAQQVGGDERLRAMVIQFVRGGLQLPSDPGDGPEIFSFYLPDDLYDEFGLNGHSPDSAVRRALAAFVNAAQKQPSSQRSLGETQDDPWSPARAASLLKLALFIGVGAGTWLVMRSGRVKQELPASEGEEPSAEDYSSWEPAP